MKAQLLTSAALLTVFCSALPAADPRLLNLVMPDAKVLAGINVAQAKNTPFGQYVLSQMQSHAADMQQLVAQTGFDPRQDVTELLMASNSAANNHAGLAVATGTFNVASITAFAAQNKATSETYKGVNILEDPKQTHGVAFLNGSLVATGDIENVKAAIDRYTTPSALPPAIAVQVGQLSTSEDGWVLCTVSPTSLLPKGATDKLTGGANGAQNPLANLQQASGGVKFGSTVSFTAQLQAGNAQDASGMAGMLQLFANMAQLKASENPQMANLAKSIVINSVGNTVNVSLSLPADQFQQMIQPKAHAVRPRANVRK